MNIITMTFRFDIEITDEDRKDLWERYLKLHPTFKVASYCIHFITPFRLECKGCVGMVWP